MGGDVAKHSTKAERTKVETYVNLKKFEFISPAFQALSGDEVLVYLAMRFRYNGRNNGQICFSSRQAGVVINKSHSTGARALRRLTELGFIKKSQDSTFGQKRLSREYELTAIDLKPAEKKNRLPDGTKDFMKWKAKEIAAMDERKAKALKAKASVMGGANSVMGAKGLESPARLRVI